MLLLTNTLDTQEVQKEVGKLAAYLDEHIPMLISFGIRVLIAIVVFIIGSRIIKFIRKLVRRSLERSGADMGLKQFLDSLIKAVLYAILIFAIAVRFGVEPASVAALIGSAGLALGLALQGSLSNFAGGVLILLLRPFVVGDYIIEDTHKNEGTVMEISLFYTKLSTVDNKIIVIPNGALANSSLTNVTAQDNRRLDLSVGISYTSDLKKAKQILEEILAGEPAVLKDEEVLVFVDQLADSSVVLACRAWVRMDEYWATRWKLNEEIKLTFDQYGIEIPFHQIDVTIKQ